MPDYAQVFEQALAYTRDEMSGYENPEPKLAYSIAHEWCDEHYPELDCARDIAGDVLAHLS